MKKIFTLLSVFLMATGINAGGIDYQFNWGTSIEGNVSQAANVIGVKKASDGNYFVSLVWGGTTAAGKTISWGGQNLQDASGADIEGADYSSGNSYTPNLLFAKTDKTTGNPIWKVYTNFGYVNNSNCSFTSTADGGAILLVSVPNGMTTCLHRCAGDKSQFCRSLQYLQDDSLHPPTVVPIPVILHRRQL